jgi:TonB-linked SusC/RagA family outer membrane protein
MKIRLINVSLMFKKRLLKIVMKTFIFFLCTTIFAMSPNNVVSQNSKIKVDKDTVLTVDEIFDLIMQQTDYKFFYEEGIFNDFPKVALKKGTIRTSKLLKKSLSQGDLDVSVTSKNAILIKQKPKVSVIIPQQQVSGKVVDALGVPLPGVSIIIQGTTTGTQTDFDGNYTLAANQGDVLEFSYLGMATQTITVGAEATINVTLQEDTAQLEEVVIVGYGQRSRKTLAGSIGQISGDVLEERPVTNVLNGLQGTIPGLTITRSQGRPGGEGYNLNIRGLNSLNGGNTPLVLIDGVEGDINLINPNDIKTVTVLKDASAAIYGARAAGGVLLITTKTGRKNTVPKITYSSNYAINRRSNLLERVNLRQWVEMDWEAKLAGGSNAQFAAGGANTTLEEALAKVDAGADPDNFRSNLYLFYKPVNWESALFDDGVQQSHNVSISGGGENSDYQASVGFVRTDGILKNAWDSNERLNFRFNHGYNIGERLRIETKISYDRNRNLESIWGARSIFESYVAHFVFFPIYTRDDPSKHFSQWGFRNPRKIAEKDEGKITRVNENLRGNFLLNYKITNDLTLRSQVGLNRSIGNSTAFANISQVYDYDGNITQTYRQRNSLSEATSQSTYKNYTAYLDYHKVFADKHDVSVTAGASHEENESTGFNALRRDFTQTEVLNLDLGSTDTQENGAFGSHWAIDSYFGRLTYIFNSKYIAEVNYRRDGTSVFSPDQRWGDFGGVSLSWLASEENFIKNLNVFDHLKVRVSQGTTGNQNLNSGNLYDYIALIDIGGQYPFGDGEQAQSASERRIVSQSRTWEDLKTTNIGIDFAFFNSKLSGTFDVFKKENDNMLLGVNLPSVLGGAPPSQNIGSLETKGFELSLNWKNNISDDFSYSIGAVLSDNINKLVDLDGRDFLDLADGDGENRSSSVREGYALGTIFGWVWDGIIQNQVELNEYKKLEGVPQDIQIGDSRYKDVNGDGKLSVFDDEGNDADIINLGTNVARYNFAINLAANYKNWDFSTFIQGVGKRTIFYEGNFALPFRSPWWQPLKRFYGNTWTSDNPTAKYPRLTTGGIRFYNYRPSENTKVSGAYARFKNITLGYTLSGSVTEKIGIDNLRLYFSGEDLFTIDAVDGGYDAENTNGSHTNYPFTKRYSLGLTLTF